jgi:hypothetical protein
MELGETAYKDVKWIKLPQDGVQWQTLVLLHYQYVQFPFTIETNLSLQNLITVLRRLLSYMILGPVRTTERLRWCFITLDFTHTIILHIQIGINLQPTNKTLCYIANKHNTLNV